MTVWCSTYSLYCTARLLLFSPIFLPQNVPGILCLEGAQHLRRTGLALYIGALRSQQRPQELQMWENLPAPPSSWPRQAESMLPSSCKQHLPSVEVSSLQSKQQLLLRPTTAPEPNLPSSSASCILFCGLIILFYPSRTESHQVSGQIS